MEEAKQEMSIEKNQFISDIKLIVEAEESLSDLKGGIFNRLLEICLHDGRLNADIIEEIEGELKAQGVAAMPVAFRTAKSVLVRAEAFHVPLLDEYSKPRGKSELERDIKAAELLGLQLEHTQRQSLTDSVHGKWTKQFRAVYRVLEAHAPELEPRFMDLWADFDAKFK